MSYLFAFCRDRSPVKRTLSAPLGKYRVAFEFEHAVLTVSQLDGLSPKVCKASLKSDRLCLIGRIRLDASEMLREELGVGDEEGEAMLCLLSYLRWGERCTEHLQGDFSFAIWDEDKQFALCARDQLGVRPLYYAQCRNVLYVGDSLEEVRAWTNATALDEFWILDFLSKGRSREFHRTVYKEISRIPPAHILTASSARHEVRRYWRLELNSPLFLRGDDYLAQFHELITAAIKDRLPQEGKVGISMSGGLDSTTLAAKTVAIVGNPNRVIAETQYFNHLIHNEEAYFSSLVARELGVKHILTPADESFFDCLWHTRRIRTPEPTCSVISMYPRLALEAKMAKEASVWFLGEGPDNALTHEWQAYLRWLWIEKDWVRFAAALRSFVFGRSPLAWAITTKRKAMAFLRSEKKHGTKWLNETFLAKLGGPETVNLRDSSQQLSPHAWRPRAMSSFADPIWQNFLEKSDPAVSQTPRDWRHPFLDLRVLNFLLRTPPIPWASRKLLIRRAMEGMLPQEILSRDKTPLSEDPMSTVVQKEEHQPPPLCEEARYYVNESALPNRPNDSSEQYGLLLVRVLDYWLRNRN